jgi:23S rRNA pseudouridine2605 synthase
MEKGTRIQKVLSEQGIVSRRKAEEWIEQGKIKVNGRPASLGQKINPNRDVVTIDGERVYFQKSSQKYYIMLHKPRGYVTTMNDELGRKCVAELVEDVPERVYPIGRLDKDSEGMLLFTNDGDFANLIMHPSHHVSKTYRVTVRPDISDAQVIQLSTGVVIDGKKTSPAHVTVLEKAPGRVVLQVVIYEGRNRQVRKMCEAVGLEVARLKRTAIGPLKLGMLAPGKWRELRPGEIGMIRNAVKTSAGTPEVLGDLDEELLGKAAKSRKPRVQQGAFQGKNAGRNDEMIREQSRERGGLRQNQSRSYQPRSNARGGKPYSKGAGNKPFTKKGSGM